MPIEYAYHPDMLEDCPLPDREPAGIVYRAIERFPAVAEDFISDVEADRSWTRKDKRCKYWGCSVWKTEEGVLHGRKVYNHFKERWIVKGRLQPQDGEVCDTPTKKQPLHSTFWKVHGLDVSDKFKLAHPPIPADPDDPLGPLGV